MLNHYDDFNKEAGNRLPYALASCARTPCYHLFSLGAYLPIYFLLHIFFKFMPQNYGEFFYAVSKGAWSGA